MLQCVHFLLVSIVPKYSCDVGPRISKYQGLRDTESFSNSTTYTGVGLLFLSVTLTACASCTMRVLYRRDKSSVDGLPKRFGWLKTFRVVTSSSLQVLG